MNVMVIGAGQMGIGIAQVCAQAGYHVYLNDLDQSLIEGQLTKLKASLAKQVEKGKMTEEAAESTFARILPTVSYDPAASCDLVIEAAVEKMEIKKSIFGKLDEICPDKTIFATNTSSLPITEISSSIRRPEKMIGMHFMQPVPVMSLVEVIRGLATDDETYGEVYHIIEELGKFPVEVRDVPGFISNRVLMVMINEAIYALYEGVASVSGIDEIMKRGMNHPMGPLELADFVGLDTVLAIMKTMYEGYSDSKYRPCPLLKQYVSVGWLGKKSGRGFYNYS